MVKLIVSIGGRLYEVVRYDSAHECPHKDVLDPNGAIKRKIWYNLLDNKQALDIAVRDLKDNADIYI
ncbi:MAG: hypothetical protein HY755_06165 [Nitrospirae bacterium]|nr:hypothetical protein [Nitrospirota bacterium]